MQVQSRSESSAVSTVLPAIESLQGAPLGAQKPTKVKPVNGLKFPLTTLGQKRPLEWLATGLPDLDALLGGGIPKGRIIECFGGESSGKTTFGVKCLAQTQKVGGVAALIEPENSLDPDYAVRLGVQIDNVLFGQPATGDEAFLLLGELIDNNACDLIVLDSIAALLPKLPDGTFYDDCYQHAYMLSQGLKFLNNKLSKADRLCTLLFTNQLRFTGGGNTPTGGKAMGFFASLRLEFKKDRTGNKITVTVKKSKTSPAKGSVKLTLLEGQGLSASTPSV